MHNVSKMSGACALRVNVWGAAYDTRFQRFIHAGRMNPGRWPGLG